MDPDVAGYQVYRSETSPVLAEAGSLLGGGSATVFTDATAVNGTAYFYAVAALDTAGNTSVLSGEASATPIAPDVTAPAVPVSLAVTSGTGLPVTLAWDLGTEPDLAGYRVYRAAGTGPVSTSDELLSADLVTGPTFTDATAASEVVYSYAVAAVDTTGNASALSGSVTATPDVTAPGAPTGLAATAGDAQVELSWTAPVDPMWPATRCTGRRPARCWPRPGRCSVGAVPRCSPTPPRSTAPRTSTRSPRSTPRATPRCCPARPPRPRSPRMSRRRRCR